ARVTRPTHRDPVPDSRAGPVQGTSKVLSRPAAHRDGADGSGRDHRRPGLTARARGQRRRRPALKTISIRRPSVRTALLVAALVAGVTGSVVAPASPAAANVPGLTQVTVTSPVSAAGKTVTATCPFGTRVINAGGYLT